MKNRKLKLLAFTCALALGIPTASMVSAQTINVPVTLTTTSGITLASVTDMDFGEWLILLGGDDVNNTLVMNPVTGAVVGGNTPGTDTTDNSTRVNIVAGASVGAITIETPAAASVNMTATVNDFTDVDITLSAPTFALNGTLGGTIGAPSAIAATGGTDSITIGGTITFTDTPPDTAHTASVDLTFAY